MSIIPLDCDFIMTELSSTQIYAVSFTSNHLLTLIATNPSSIVYGKEVIFKSLAQSHCQHF